MLITLSVKKFARTQAVLQRLYRVFQKTDPLICFCNNFGKCTPILILFSLLQQENYGTQNLRYFSHLTFVMLPLYLAKQILILYQCHYYVIIVFVYNLLHFHAFNHLHRLIWAE